MKFGRVRVIQAAGSILAHALKLGPVRLEKGRILTETTLAQIAASGQDEIIVATLEPGDVPEDAAAERAAAKLFKGDLFPSPARTGRVNIFAESSGLLQIDADEITRLNGVSPSLTIATLSPYSVVKPGQMVATIKVIPYASDETTVAAWQSAKPPLDLLPFRKHRVGLIQTMLPGLKSSVVEKTVKTMRDRLEAYGSTLGAELRIAHTAEDIAAALKQMMPPGDRDDTHDQGIDMVILCGASAIIDRRDVIPTGIEHAGGAVEIFGMPVDPGNLLLLARLGGKPIIGMPGCARSPRLNGFDFVLQRLLAGVTVDQGMINALGVGGLLTEIWSRPLPREAIGLVAPDGDEAGIPMSEPKIGILILAAGRSRRMGQNKLLMTVDGKPMIRHIAEAALASRAECVSVVTGHQATDITAVLAGLNLGFIHNPDYADGLSTSLRQGIAHQPRRLDGSLICLADMPGVDTKLLDRLIDAVETQHHHRIVVPVRGGKRGNPVLWGRDFFPQLLTLNGDIGAKHIIADHPDAVIEIEAEDDGVLQDLDTLEALARWHQQPR